jgi:chaperonin GroES
VAKRLIPLFDRVLIQKAEAVTKTKSGIVIPEKAQAKVLRGTVVAVGPGARNQVYVTQSFLFLIFTPE